MKIHNYQREVKTSRSSHRNINEKRLVSLWDDENHFKGVHERLILTLCKDVGSELSDRVSTLIKNQDYNTLITVDISPNDYIDNLCYAGDAAIIGLIKKYPYWNIDLDPVFEAKKKFIAAELACFETNQRIREGCLHDNPVHATILGIAAHKISQILGDAPEINEIPFKFGPGANYNVKNNTSAFDKLGSSLDITPNCRGLAEKFLSTCPGWLSMHVCMDSYLSMSHGIRRVLNEVPGDQLGFVPKNAKTHRPIGVTALVNSVIQKGIGSCIRHKLKPILDLKNLQSRHRQLAQAASRDKSLATIDLSMASDTISYGIILELFPQGWFDLMDQARAPSYKIEDKWYDYHKFSAMGNGFTFEMESLLFFALASAVAEHLNVSGPVSVYGDDIIIPTECAELLTEVLTLCGFSINEEKSFSDGPFRESCGGDYFEGYDVRAFYLKDKISYRVLFLYHNYLVRRGLNFIYVNVFRLIRRLIGKEICDSFRGSSIEGDGHLLDLTIADAPHLVVVPVISSRTCPKYKSFNLLKAWALYRALYPEYDSTFCLYLGVNSNTRIPSNRRKKTFKTLLSTRLMTCDFNKPTYLM